MEEKILNLYLDLAVHLSMKLKEKDRLIAVKWIKIIKECNFTNNGKNLSYQILNFLLHCLRRKILIAFSNNKIQKINFQPSSKEVLNQQLTIRSSAGLDETSDLNISKSKKQHNARFKTCQQKQISQKAKRLAYNSFPNFEKSSDNASDNLQYHKSKLNNFKNMIHTARYNRIKCSEEFNRLRNKLRKLKNQVSFSIPSDNLSNSLERQAPISDYRHHIPKLSNMKQFKSNSCPQNMFSMTPSSIRGTFPEISECDQLQNETFPSSNFSQSLERRTPKNNFRPHIQHVSDTEQLEDMSFPQDILSVTPPSFRRQLPEISECDQLQNETLPSFNLSQSLGRRTPIKNVKYHMQQISDMEELENISCPQDISVIKSPLFRKRLPEISDCDQLQNESRPSSNLSLSSGRRTPIKYSRDYMPHISDMEQREDKSCTQAIFSRTPPSFRRILPEISECDQLQNESIPSGTLSLSSGRLTPIKSSSCYMPHISDMEQLDEMSYPQEAFYQTPPSFRRRLPEISDCDQLQNESLPSDNLSLSSRKCTPMKHRSFYVPHISDIEQLEDMSCPQDIFSRTPPSFRRPLPQISECDQLQNESLPSGDLSLSLGKRTPIKHSNGYMPNISDMEQLQDMSCPQDLFSKTPQSFRRPLPEISECDQLQNESLPSDNFSKSLRRRSPNKHSTSYMSHLSDMEQLEDISCPQNNFSRTPQSFRRPLPQISECDHLQNESLPSGNLSLSLGKCTPIKHSTGFMPHISDMEQLQDMSFPQEIFSRTPPSVRKSLPEISVCDQLQNESLPSGNFSKSLERRSPIKHSTSYMPHLSDMEQLEDISCPQDNFSRTPQSFRRPLPEISECDQLQNESLPSRNLSLTLGRCTPIKNSSGYMPHISDMEQLEDMSCPQDVFSRSPPSFRRPLPEISECDQLQNESLPSGNFSKSLGRRSPIKHSTSYMPHLSDMEQLEDISCPQDNFSRTPQSFGRPLPEISECDQLQNESLPSGNFTKSLGRRSPIKHSTSYMPHLSDMEQLEDISCPQDNFSRTPQSFGRPLPEISECDQLQNESLPSGNFSKSLGRRSPIKHSTSYMPHLSDMEQLEDISCPQDNFSRTPQSFGRPLPEISECDQLQNESLPSRNLSLSLGRCTPIKNSSGYMPHISDMEQLEDMSCPQDVFSRTPQSFRRLLPEISECDQLQNESLPSGNFSKSLGRRSSIKHSTSYMPHLSDMEQLEDISCPQDNFSRTPQSFGRPLPEISECDQLQNESLPSGNLSLSLGRCTPIKKNSSGYMPHVSDMEQLEDMSCPQDVFSRTPQSFRRLPPEISECDQLQNESLPSGNFSKSLGRRSPIKHSTSYMPHLSDMEQLEDISCPQGNFSRTPQSFGRPLPEISECDQLQNESLPSGNLSLSSERCTPIKKNSSGYMPHISDMEQLEDMSCPQDVFSRTPQSFRRLLPEISECDQLQNESLPSGNFSKSLGRRSPIKHSTSYMPHLSDMEQLEDISCPQDNFSRTPQSFGRPLPEISECDQLQNESLPSGNLSVSLGRCTPIKHSGGYMPHISDMEQLEDMSCPQDVFFRTPPPFRRPLPEISECDQLQNESLPSRNLSLSLRKRKPVKHSSGYMHISDMEQTDDMSYPQEIFCQTPQSFRRPLPQISECDQLQNQSPPSGNFSKSLGKRSPIKHSTSYMSHLSDMEQLEDISCPQDNFSRTPQSFRRPLPEISECDQLQNESLPSGNLSVSLGKCTPIKHSSGYMPHISDMEQLEDISCPQDNFSRTPQSFGRPLPEISECDQLQNESLPSGNLSVSLRRCTPIKHSSGYMPHVSDMEQLEDISCPQDNFSRTPQSFRKPLPEISECDQLQNESLPSGNLSLSLGKRRPVKHSSGYMHISDMEQIDDMSYPQEIFCQTPQSFRRPLPQISECDQLQNQSPPFGNFSKSLGKRSPIKHSTSYMSHLSDMEQLEDISCPQNNFSRTPQSFRRPLPEISECDQLQNESLPSGNLSVSLGRCTPIKHSSGYMPHISDMEQLEDISCPQDNFSRTPQSFGRPLPEISECDQLQNESLPSGNLSVSLGRCTPIKHSSGYMPHVSDMEQLEDISCPQDNFSRTPQSFRKPLPEISECDQLQNESLPSGNLSLSLGKRKPVKHSSGYMHISDMEQIDNMSCPQEIFCQTPQSFRGPLPQISECAQLQNESLPSCNFSKSLGRRSPIKHSTSYMSHLSDMEQLEDISCPQNNFSRTPQSFRRPLPEISECDQLQNESQPSGNLSPSLGRCTPIKHSTGYMPQISEMEQLQDISCPQGIFSRTPPSVRKPLPEISECDQLQNESLPSCNFSKSLGRRSPVKHSTSYMSHLSEIEQLEDISCPEDNFSRTPQSFRRPLPEISECDQLQNESQPSGNLSLSLGRCTPIKHSTGYMPHISDKEQLDDMSCPQDIFSRTPPSFRRQLPEISDCDQIQNESLPSDIFSKSLGRRTPIKHSTAYMPHISDMEELKDMSCPPDIFNRTPPSFRRLLSEIFECDQLENESLPSGNLSLSSGRRTPIKHSSGYMLHVSDMEQLDDMSCPQDIFSRTPPSFRRQLPEISDCDQIQNESLPLGNFSQSLGRRTQIKNAASFIPHMPDKEQLENMSCPQDIFNRTPPSFGRLLSEISECDQLQNESLPSGNFSFSSGRVTAKKQSTCQMPHLSDMEQLEDTSCPEDVFSTTPPTFRSRFGEISEFDQLQNESLPSEYFSLSLGRCSPIKHSSGYVPEISDIGQIKDISPLSIPKKKCYLRGGDESEVLYSLLNMCNEPVLGTKMMDEILNIQKFLQVMKGLTSQCNQYVKYCEKTVNDEM